MKHRYFKYIKRYAVAGVDKMSASWWNDHNKAFIRNWYLTPW